ncbi:hypothetical protein [Bosea sp. NBC_00550]|uniref:hypothetical protein n=1 Tax=Bosea sp. NBC_00550 TaxID=2969621 RepID=UPI00222FD27B|nr:hypothetical protein [Bosea sp. NBC_00550]UZF94954.1 hypothetical protein NWE53_12695 [Bosea sp. NBC_00550]
MMSCDEDARKPDTALLAAADLLRIENEMGLRQADRLDDRLGMLPSRGARPIGMDDQPLMPRAALDPARIE